MSQERIIKSLNVLGLDSSATQEQITDRVKVLKAFIIVNLKQMRKKWMKFIARVNFC